MSAARFSLGAYFRSVVSPAMRPVIASTATGFVPSCVGHEFERPNSCPFTVSSFAVLTRAPGNLRNAMCSASFFVIFA